MPPQATIMTIDCLEGMRSLPSGSVDVIVTSPPYNIGKPYRTHQDTIPRDQYLRWMGTIAVESRRILKEEGSFFLNVGGKPTDPWIPFDVIAAFRPHYALQNVIHWVKSIAIAKEDAGNYPSITGDIGVGHYQPVNSPRYLSQCHEHIFHFTGSGDVTLDKFAIGVPYQDKSNIGRWQRAGHDVRDRGNTWFIPYRTVRTARAHPTTFPERLPEMCVKLHGIQPEMVVLDPFMGIGSTAAACVHLGVSFIGFEIDEEYARIARDRVEHLLREREP